MAPDGAAGVVQLDPADAPRVVAVLAEAFHDYPVMRFVIGGSGADHARRLHTLVRFFVMARALRDEPLLGIGNGPELEAAATVSHPEREGSPPELAELRELVWEELGHEARARYELCTRVWAGFARPETHVHLNMIGVRPRHRGRGLARRLLEHVHRLSATKPGSVGVKLTTEDPANLPIYRRLGYEVVGHARIAPDLETWSLFRAN